MPFTLKKHKAIKDKKIQIFLVHYLNMEPKLAQRLVSKGRIFDENFLMSVATIGAIAIGELSEAVGVMLFYKIGEAMHRFSHTYNNLYVKFNLYPLKCIRH